MVLVDTNGEKLKAIQLHILETQWAMCKVDTHVLALANKLKNKRLGNALLALLISTSAIVLQGY